jgi:transcriptional regulator with XRE-family HTH domain
VKQASLLKKLRAERGLTQARLGAKTGMSVQQISNIENGRAPMPGKRIPFVAQALGVTQEEIFEHYHGWKHRLAKGQIIEYREVVEAVATLKFPPKA